MKQLGFWKQFLKAAREEGKPILAMAPMADVTDAALRLTVAKLHQKSRALFHESRPISKVHSSPSNSYITWNEFVPIEGLHHNPKAFEVDLWFDSGVERPAVAQVFGASPERMRKAVSDLVAQGWHGIDINMGCPDRSVTEKQRAGAALITDAALARDLVAAAIEGAAGQVPVSVKTRLGYTIDEAEMWTDALLGGGEEVRVMPVLVRRRQEEWRLMMFSTTHPASHSGRLLEQASLQSHSTEEQPKR